MGQTRRDTEYATFGRRSLRVSLGLAAWLVMGLAAGIARPHAAEPGADVRGLWVLRTTLTSPARIDRLVRDAVDNGFNALFLQVRGRGDAFYAGSPEPRGDGIAPGFDPLGHALAAAHRAGLRVHVWFNVNLIASAVTLPADPSHVVRTHPEWLMVPRDLAPALGGLAPHDRRYVARLAAWTRERPNRVEGLYVSPIPVDAARYLEAMVADVAARYPIDGLHLDYIRYPGPQFDYSAGALSAFRESLLPELAADERLRLDARRSREPLVYANRFPARWSHFRRTRLADLVARLRLAVKTRRPAAWVSAAVIPDAGEAFRDRLQDWPDWARRGLIDAVCPMTYTTSVSRFSEQVDAVRGAVRPQAVWAGIGAYRLRPAQIVEHIGAARSAGAEGVILFSYDSLSAGSGQAEALRAIRRAAFAGSPPAVSSTR